MSRPFDSVDDKVRAIFRELVEDRVRRLDGSVVAREVMDVIGDALTDSYGVEKAHEIAFHMADWNSDAAFIDALHLFPEEFTPQEVEAGIGLFLVHAPNHIRQACGLTGNDVWENWPDD